MTHTAYSWARNRTMVNRSEHSFTPPANARLVLWSAAAGTILFQSDRAPSRLMLGEQPRHVDGPAIMPAVGDLCGAPKPEWRDALILSDDWTAGGCSTETRLRSFQEVGTRAALFLGTEGLPFDWDGTNRESIRSIVGISINPGDYRRMSAALARSVNSDGRDWHYIWCAPEDSPLLGSVPFIVTDRSMQVALMLAVACNVAFASSQLRKAHRGAPVRKKSRINTAVLVLICELASQMLYLVYLVDGPSLEHTRPAMLSFIVARLVTIVGLQLQSVSILVIALHLRQIRRRAEGRSSTAMSTTRDKLSAIVRPSLAHLHGPDRATTTEPTRRPSLADALTLAIGMSSQLRVEYALILIFVGMIIGDIVVNGILTGLYLGTDALTFVMVLYNALLKILVGAWFVWEGKVISRMLSNSNASRNAHTHHRFVRGARRVGLTINLTVAMLVAHELLRTALHEEGGWAYWWSMLGTSTAAIITLVVQSTLTISMFRPHSIVARTQQRATEASINVPPNTTPSNNAQARKTSIESVVFRSAFRASASSFETNMDDDLSSMASNAGSNDPSPDARRATQTTTNVELDANDA